MSKAKAKAKVVKKAAPKVEVVGALRPVDMEFNGEALTVHVDDAGGLWLTARESSKGLGFGEGRREVERFRQLARRHKGEIEALSVAFDLKATDGKSYRTKLYHEKAVTILCCHARTEKADAFRLSLADLMADLRRGTKQLVETTPEPLAPGVEALVAQITQRVTAQVMEDLVRPLVRENAVQRQRIAELEAVNRSIDTELGLTSDAVAALSRLCASALATRRWQKSDARVLRQLRQERLLPGFDRASSWSASDLATLERLKRLGMAPADLAPANAS